MHERFEALDLAQSVSGDLSIRLSVDQLQPRIAALNAQRVAFRLQAFVRRPVNLGTPRTFTGTAFPFFDRHANRPRTGNPGDAQTYYHAGLNHQVQAKSSR